MMLELLTDRKKGYWVVSTALEANRVRKPVIYVVDFITFASFRGGDHFLMNIITCTKE